MHMLTMGVGLTIGITDAIKIRKPLPAAGAAGQAGLVHVRMNSGVQLAGLSLGAVGLLGHSACAGARESQRDPLKQPLRA